MTFGPIGPEEPMLFSDPDALDAFRVRYNEALRQARASAQPMTDAEREWCRRLARELAAFARGDKD